MVSQLSVSYWLFIVFGSFNVFIIMNKGEVKIVFVNSNDDCYYVWGFWDLDVVNIIYYNIIY